MVGTAGLYHAPRKDVNSQPPSENLLELKGEKPKSIMFLMPAWKIELQPKRTRKHSNCSRENTKMKGDTIKIILHTGDLYVM